MLLCYYLRDIYIVIGLTKAFQGQDSKIMQSVYTGYESLLLPAVLRSH